MGFHNTALPTYNLKHEHLFPFSIYLPEFIYTECLFALRKSCYAETLGIKRSWNNGSHAVFPELRVFSSVEKDVKNHRIKEFFPWEILWDSQPKECSDENVNTESGRLSFFLLLLKLCHGSSPWRTQRQCSFIWHLKDVVALSRLGQAFSIFRRMALGDKWPILRHLAAATIHKEARVDLSQLIPVYQWDDPGNSQKMLIHGHHIPTTISTKALLTLMVPLLRLT